jgi:hypothetical protein
MKRLKPALDLKNIIFPECISKCAAFKYGGDCKIICPEKLQLQKESNHDSK